MSQTQIKQFLLDINLFFFSLATNFLIFKQLSSKYEFLLVWASTTIGELSPSSPSAITLRVYSAVGISPEKVISVWSGKREDRGFNKAQIKQKLTKTKNESSF